MRRAITIATGLDIPNCIDFHADRDQGVRGLLIANFQAKCFRGVLIEKIISVDRVSDCLINQLGPPTSGTISVIFTASALCYRPGDIVPGCRLGAKRDRAFFVGIAPSALAFMGADAGLTGFRTGQIVPVRIRSLRAPPGKSTYLIDAELALPDRRVRYYVVGSGGAGGAARDYIRPSSAEPSICTQLEAATDAAGMIKKAIEATKDAEAVAFVRSILGAGAGAGAGAGVVSILADFPAAVGTPGTVVIIDPAICCLEGKVRVARAPPNGGVQMAPALPADEVVSAIRDEFINRAVAFVEMLATYSAPGVLGENAALVGAVKNAAK